MWTSCLANLGCRSSIYCPSSTVSAINQTGRFDLRSTTCCSSRPSTLESRADTDKVSAMCSERWSERMDKVIFLTDVAEARCYREIQLAEMVIYGNHAAAERIRARAMKRLEPYRKVWWKEPATPEKPE